MIEQIDHDFYYFEDAPIWKAIVHMSLPMMLGLCLNAIYNIVDAYFIGKLGQTSMLSAIALVLPFTTIQMAIGNLFGTGGSTYISRLLGEKNYEKAKIVSAVTFYLSIIAGIVFLSIGLQIYNPILHLLGAKGDTIKPTGNLILAFLVGSPILIANFTLGQVLRSEGASTQSMYGMGISVVINIVFDPILIFGCGMGVLGAAVSTVLGSLCAVIYYTVYLHMKSSVLTVSMKMFRIDLDMLIEIFKIGVTALIQDVFLIVSALLLNNFSASYGDYAIAAFGIAQRVVQIADFIGMGLFIGVVPLIAYSFTAHHITRMKKIIQVTASYIIVLILLIAVVMMIFRTQVFELFSEDQKVISVGVVILAALLISSLFTSFSGLFIGVFQGVGREKEATIMSMAQGILLIPIMIAGNILIGLNGVIWSVTVAEILASLIGFILWHYFKKGFIA